MWLISAIFSAVFAGLTSILAKCGIKKTNSDLATAIRTVVVLIFSIIMVLIVGSLNTLKEVGLTSLIFLVLSGLATGASWICYFKALSIGDVNKVVPIDKSSTVLTVLLAIICFSETNNLAFKLIGAFILAVGILLMVERKKTEQKTESKSYIIYAILSAIFASLTSILAKVGVLGVESNLATAIRTVVVLIMAWLIVFIKGEHKSIKTLDKKEFIFICVSGVFTGASWLCYYYAIQTGIVSVVVPIDKLSIIVSVVFSYIVFKEKLSKRAFIGLVLMVLATLLMTITA